MTPKRSTARPARAATADRGASSRLVRWSDALAAAGGELPPLPELDALGWIVLENVAYLADDARRAAAFDELRARVGIEARKLFAAPLATLRAIAAKGGIHGELRGDRLREIGRIVVLELGGDLDAALAGTAADALRVLARFPAIGRPGAEKILLFTGRAPLLALESNGLRVLLRLGVAKEESSYDRSWRAVAAALADAVRGQDAPSLVRAHRLLRRHGQEICRRTAPACDRCALATECAFAAAAGTARPAVPRGRRRAGDR